MKEIYQALEDLVWLAQLGLSMMMPLLLCLGGCWWAVSHWGWPGWLYLPAVLLGLASAAAQGTLSVPAALGLALAALLGMNVLCGALAPAAPQKAAAPVRRPAPPVRVPLQVVRGGRAA